MLQCMFAVLFIRSSSSKFPILPCSRLEHIPCSESPLPPDLSTHALPFPFPSSSTCSPADKPRCQIRQRQHDNSRSKMHQAEKAQKLQILRLTDAFHMQQKSKKSVCEN